MRTLLGHRQGLRLADVGRAARSRGENAAKFTPDGRQQPDARGQARNEPAGPFFDAGQRPELYIEGYISIYIFKTLDSLA